MNVLLCLACGKTVLGYSVNVTRQENFDMPLLTTGLLRKCSNFSWKLKDNVWRNRK